MTEKRKRRVPLRPIANSTAWSAQPVPRMAFEAAVVHEAVMKLGPEDAALIIKAAVTGKWPDGFEPESDPKALADLGGQDWEAYLNRIGGETEPEKLADLLCPWLERRNPDLIRERIASAKRAVISLRKAAQALRDVDADIGRLYPLPDNLKDAIVQCEEIANGLELHFLVPKIPRYTMKNVVFKSAVKMIRINFEERTRRKATLTYHPDRGEWGGEFLDWVEQVVKILTVQLPWMHVPTTANARGEAVRDELYGSPQPAPEWFDRYLRGIGDPTWWTPEHDARLQMLLASLKKNN